MEEQNGRKQVNSGNIENAAFHGGSPVDLYQRGLRLSLVLGGAYIMTDLQKIANRLRAVASEMIDLGFSMNSSGGFSDLAVRGVELMEGGVVVNSWVDRIDESSCEIPDIGKLVNDLTQYGGVIVSTNDCLKMEIVDARATGRFAVLPDGLGVVRRTREWLELQKQREGLAS